MSLVRLLHAGRLCSLGLRAHADTLGLPVVAAALQGAIVGCGTPLWQRSFSATSNVRSEEEKVSIV